MHFIELVDLLKKELENLFDENHLELEAKGPSDRDPILVKPNIFTGWNVKKKASEDEFPYIYISPVADSSNFDENEYTVALIFGVFSFEEDGWKDLVLLSNKVKRHLKSKWELGQKFSILTDKGFTINFPDTQGYPQWFCSMLVSFHGYNIGEIESAPSLRGEF